jgi:hypothetical protein
MAKKKAGKPGGPQKTCVKCGKSMHARQKACPFCNAEQPVKAKAAMTVRKPKGAAQSTNGVSGAVTADEIRTARKLVQEGFGGDYEKAGAALKLIAKVGNVERTIAAVHDAKEFATPF